MGVSNLADRLVAGTRTAILSSGGGLTFSKDVNWIIDISGQTNGIADGNNIKIKGGDSNATAAGNGTLEGGAGTDTAISGDAIVLGGNGGTTNVGGAAIINGGPGITVGNTSIANVRGDLNLSRTGGKIGFLGATAVVRPTSTTDLRQALIDLGLYTTGGATPLNLNGGALTVGSIAATGAVALTGDMTVSEGINFKFGTVTGTQIGTASTQLLGFFGATPVQQQTATTDLRQALINLGLYKTGGASPLNLNGGAFTTTGTASTGALTTTSIAATGTVALTGNMTVSDAVNFILNTTTGTKIGTATTQKLGFFNATPIVQPAGTTDLRTALINLGLYASGGASPLNLNGGALTANTGTFSVATGTAPLTISSTTQVANLNVDQVDGLDSTAFAILAGQAGGQTLNGGTAASQDLTFSSTANATKRNIFLGSAQVTRFDELNGILAVGGAPETATFSGSTLQAINAVMVQRNAAGANTGANYFAARSRGTQAAPTVVSSGDLLNQFTAYGYSGAAAAFVNCAAIGYFVDGVPDSGGDTTDMPGRLAFYTCPDGSATLTERMRIMQDGTVAINTTAAFGSELLAILAPDNGTCLGLKINAAQASVTAADIFIEFRSTTGVEGSVAGTAVAGVIAYNTFTGSHYTQIADKTGLEPLMVLEMTGEALDDNTVVTRQIQETYLEYIGPEAERSGYLASGPVPGYVEERTRTVTETRTLAPKEQTVKSRICRTKRSKAVWGVYGGTDADGRDLCLAIGTGFVWVSKGADGANVEIGDYLMSTDIVAGDCERQGTDQLMNYTVAKAEMAIVWQAGETRRKIPCTYHCG